MNESDLITRCGSGSKATQKGHQRRIRQIRELILRRFGVHKHMQWKLKHLRWVLEHGLAERSAHSRYDFWLTVRLYAASRQRLGDWERELRGPWQNKKGESRALGVGGRPPNLPGVREKR